jgi:FAD/FMN-containing dehydrogenase
MMSDYPSWGHYPTARQHALRLRWRDEPLPSPPAGASLLPRGLGRSYGDTCLNDGGLLLDATGLDRFIAFDAERGAVRCEAGVGLDALLALSVPRGWFLPVSPGTKFVTVGGAIANDIHGKNHHRAGTFGRFVERLELVRSDGRRLVCSRDENGELFRATIGGLGLTGLITWAELRLKRVESEAIEVESVKFGGLDEFFDLAQESDRTFEYTVAWVDCLARGARLGRGIFIRGNHAAAAGTRRPPASSRRLAVPVQAPRWLLSPWALRLFNELYFRRQLRSIVRRVTHYDPFFYPLDSIAHWNRLYGPSGFMQYQFVVPHAAGRDGVRTIFTRIAESGQGSFLAVLKVFGDLPSPGLLSFPRPGVTLALDFPNRGRSTLDLLDELDGIVRGHGGRVYPAKDARMTAESFQAYFPEWRELSRHVDPAFSSSFWRRVTLTMPGGSA